MIYLLIVLLVIRIIIICLYPIAKPHFSHRAYTRERAGAAKQKSETSDSYDQRLD